MARWVPHSKTQETVHDNKHRLRYSFFAVTFVDVHTETQLAAHACIFACFSLWQINQCDFTSDRNSSCPMEGGASTHYTDL